MKKLLAMFLALCVSALSCAALAENAFFITVEAMDGMNSNYRDAPSLDGNDIGTLKDGDSLDFADEISTDDRGVDWYKVETEDGTAWVSSRYTTLTDGMTKDLSFANDLAGKTFTVIEDGELTDKPIDGEKTEDIAAGAMVTASGCYAAADPEGLDRIYLVETEDGIQGWISVSDLDSGVEQ